MMRMIQTFLVITVAGVFITQAAPDWYSLGPTDRAVRCILADDTSAIREPLYKNGAQQE